MKNNIETMSQLSKQQETIAARQGIREEYSTYLQQLREEFIQLGSGKNLQALQRLHITELRKITNLLPPYEIDKLVVLIRDIVLFTDNISAADAKKLANMQTYWRGAYNPNDTNVVPLLPLPTVELVRRARYCKPDYLAAVSQAQITSYDLQQLAKFADCLSQANVNDSPAYNLPIEYLVASKNIRYLDEFFKTVRNVADLLTVDMAQAAQSLGTLSSMVIKNNSIELRDYLNLSWTKCATLLDEFVTNQQDYLNEILLNSLKEILLSFSELAIDDTRKSVYIMVFSHLNKFLKIREAYNALSCFINLTVFNERVDDIIIFFRKNNFYYFSVLAILMPDIYSKFRAHLISLFSQLQVTAPIFYLVLTYWFCYLPTQQQLLGFYRMQLQTLDTNHLTATDINAILFFTRQELVDVLIAKLFIPETISWIKNDYLRLSIIMTDALAINAIRRCSNSQSIIVNYLNKVCKFALQVTELEQVQHLLDYISASRRTKYQRKLADRLQILQLTAELSDTSILSENEKAEILQMSLKHKIHFLLRYFSNPVHLLDCHKVQHLPDYQVFTRLIFYAANMGLTLPSSSNLLQDAIQDNPFNAELYSLAATNNKTMKLKKYVGSVIRYMSINKPSLFANRKTISNYKKSTAEFDSLCIAIKGLQYYGGALANTWLDFLILNLFWFSRQDLLNSPQQLLLNQDVIYQMVDLKQFLSNNFPAYNKIAEQPKIKLIICKVYWAVELLQRFIMGNFLVFTGLEQLEKIRLDYLLNVALGLNEKSLSWSETGWLVNLSRCYSSQTRADCLDWSGIGWKYIINLVRCLQSFVLQLIMKLDLSTQQLGSFMSTLATFHPTPNMSMRFKLIDCHKMLQACQQEMLANNFERETAANDDKLIASNDVVLPGQSIREYKCS